MKLEFRKTHVACSQITTGCSFAYGCNLEESVVVWAFENVEVMFSNMIRNSKYRIYFFQ